MAAAEIIDLTLSPTRSVINIEEDVEEVSQPPNTVETRYETRKERTRRRYAETLKKGKEEDNNENFKENPNFNVNSSENKRGREEDIDSARSNKRRRTPSSSLPFFTLDANPSEIDSIPTQTDAPSSHRSSLKPLFHTINGLLLPSHITVVADDPPLRMEGHDTQPLSPVSDATGIDFLDDDRAVGARRYFEDTRVTVCKKCGEKGHDFRDCTTLICLTCDARNEHTTRSCPALRVCFDCQGKGHLAKDCPRIGSMDRLGPSQDCDRCGSHKHNGSNCPTLWRIYTYVTDAERDAFLENRESKRGLDFGGGGEGYIARDHWCYNCSRSGHLGDDCSDIENADKPDEHSAFGKFNWLTGPFASVTSSAPHVERAPRLWERDDLFNDGRGFSIEGNVGRKGREKNRQRAAEAQKRLEDDDDEPDWFSRNREGATNNSQNSRPSNSSRHSQPTFHFGSEKKSNSAGSGSRVSLLDRIDTGGGQGSGVSRRVSTGSSQGRERGSDKKKNNDKGHGRNDRRRDDFRRYERGDRNHERHRDRYEASRDRGSHWRRGYDNS